MLQTVPCPRPVCLLIHIALQCAPAFLQWSGCTQTHQGSLCLQLSVQAVGCLPRLSLALCCLQACHPRALACSPSRKLLAMVEPVGGFHPLQPTLNGTAPLQPNAMDPRQLKVEPEEQGPVGVLNDTQEQQSQQLTPARSAYQAPVAAAGGGSGAPSLGPASGAEARGQGLEGEVAAAAVEGVHFGAQEVEFVCQLVQGLPGIFRAPVHALMTPQAGGFVGRPPTDMLPAFMLVLMVLPATVTAPLQGHRLQ